MDRNDITLTNQRNSPLLRLPPELRHRIYQYVFTGHEINISRVQPTIDYLHYRSSHPPNTFWSTHPFRFTLNRTCRQLYHETARLTSLFWTHNTFSGSALGVACFLRRHSAEADLLRTLHVYVGGIVSTSSYAFKPLELTMSLKALLRSLRALAALETVVLVQETQRLAGYEHEQVLDEARRVFGAEAGQRHHQVDILLRCS
ncbi:hypothetical protein C7974DRAFT_451219 [Boeremia exigua]|uniref:uncharacterized protein n=1 Tax=Boeremia exigua TaxID=749465 RepID=UPI001E8D396D|nr:uncharacterized protein C7974DRAFT_451219 [Boeremia exigua]KAH6638014.1 hypothetical protein C7974DRAFT_451219 [Boeremia exigua]